MRLLEKLGDTAHADSRNSFLGETAHPSLEVDVQILRTWFCRRLGIYGLGAQTIELVE